MVLFFKKLLRSYLDFVSFKISFFFITLGIIHGFYERAMSVGKWDNGWTLERGGEEFVKFLNPRVIVRNRVNRFSHTWLVFNGQLSGNLRKAVRDREVEVVVNSWHLE